MQRRSLVSMKRTPRLTLRRPSPLACGRWLGMLFPVVLNVIIQTCLHALVLQKPQRSKHLALLGIALQREMQELPQLDPVITILDRLQIGNPVFLWVRKAITRGHELGECRFYRGGFRHAAFPEMGTQLNQPRRKECNQHGNPDWNLSIHCSAQRLQ